MIAMHPVLVAALGLVVAKWFVELWLAYLNRRHVLACASELPPAFQGMIDSPTYDKSVRYTLAKNSLHHWECTYDTIVLVLVLASGVLPFSWRFFVAQFGDSTAAMAGFLFAVGSVFAIAGLPLAWYSQFRLEDRFGFNTSTQKLWWLDRLKGFLLAAIFGFPLLWLVLKLFVWMGSSWWFWAWAAIMAFQLLMMVLAPMLIMPLFNKFTTLPEGSLRERLLALGARTAFPARNIQIMDGSKRSRHSNAFFTGFGRFRKIVLFDTLLAQLSESEMEAVLAHEIGHYKRQHITRMLAWSAAASLGGFYLLGVLARQDWLIRAFGFAPGNPAVAVLLLALLGGAVTFWLTPLVNYWSRCYEYEADAYAARTIGGAAPLAGALRKLNQKNLSNLTPHPLFSRFYYSHPTLLEREAALNQLGGSKAAVATL